jgi:MFS family permease
VSFVPTAHQAPAQGIGFVLAAMIACQVGLHACVQGVRLAAPLNLLHQGQSAWWVGIVLSMFAIGPALLAIPAGRLADRHGYHLPVRIASLCSIGGTLLAASVQNNITGCIAAALCGIGSGVGMIAIQRSASRLASSGPERLRVFSSIALAPALAGLFGPMLAGVLIDRAGFSTAFLALALLPAATLFIAQAIPREIPQPAASAAANKSSTGGLLRLARFRHLLFISWLVSASWDVHGFALPVLGVERGVSASALGAVLAAYALASMSVRLLIPLLAERLAQRTLLIGPLVLTGAVFALYPIQLQVWGMGVCAAVLGIAFGAIQPAIMATLHDVTPPERHGEALGVRSLALHVSMAVMPMLFGVVAAGAGAAALFWMMAAALGAGSVIAFRLTSAGSKPN